MSVNTTGNDAEKSISTKRASNKHDQKIIGNENFK